MTEYVNRQVCTAIINDITLVKMAKCHPHTLETIEEYWTENGNRISNKLVQQLIYGAYGDS